MATRNYEVDSMQEHDPLLSPPARGDVYQPLNAAKKEIRVLDLLPRWHKSDIRCRLRTIALNDGPVAKYEALSYTWGSSSEGRNITILTSTGPFTLPVTNNLFRALRGLRPRIGRPRVLWADAVCINQADDGEKSAQVGMMGEVYMLAQCVNVWVGEPVKSTVSDSVGALAAFWLVIRLIFRDPTNWVGFNRDRDPVDSTLSNPQPSFVAEVWRQRSLLWRIIRCQPHRLKNALEVTDPAWQTRAWVVQEFVLASQAYVCFGRERLDPSWVWKFDDALRAGESRVDYSPAESRAVRIDSFNALKDSPRSDLLDVFARVSFGRAEPASSTNPRDKVFALLGLIDARYSGLIVPDYQAPCWRVFANATFAYVDTERKFDILQLPTRRVTASIEGLPTWATDFTKGPGEFTHTFDLVQWPESSPDYVVATLDRTQRHLRLTGVELGDVDAALVLKEWPTGELAGRETAANADDWEALASLIEKSKKGLPVPKCGNPLCEAQESVRSRVVRTCSNHPLTAQELYETSSLCSDEMLQAVMQCFLHWRATTTLEDDKGIPLSNAPTPNNGPSTNYPNHYHGPSDSPSLGVQSFRWLDISNYADYADHVVGKLAFIATTTGFLGLAPGDVAVGDKIILVKGSRLPLLIRKCGDYWSFQGLVYIHRTMDSELLRAWKDVELHETEYVLC